MYLKHEYLETNIISRAQALVLLLVTVLPTTLSACNESSSLVVPTQAPRNTVAEPPPRTLTPEELAPSNGDLPLGFVTYEVKQSDSLFAISDEFGVSPESILFCNKTLLEDNPHMLRPGIEILIPPMDGALYEWQSGDRLAGVAGRHRVDPDLIVAWVGNGLDYGEYLNEGQIQIPAGRVIFIPLGRRPFESIFPTTPRIE